MMPSGLVSFFPVDNNTMDVIRLLMVPVITLLVINPDKDQEAAAHTDSQAEDIYKGISFMPKYAAYRRFEIIAYHNHISPDLLL